MSLRCRKISLCSVGIMNGTIENYLQKLFVAVQHFATKLSVTSDGLALCAMLSNKTIHMYSIFGSLLWESSSWNFKVRRFSR